MSGPDSIAEVHLPGGALHNLIAAIAAMASVEIGPFAIIGGVAVNARLGQAHGATLDVDSVVDQDHSPSAIDVLISLPAGRPDPDGGAHRIFLHDTKLEFLPTGRVPSLADLDGIAPRQRLFLLAHAWALSTATSLPSSATLPR